MSDRSVVDTARSRLFVLVALIMAMVLALMGRLWFLQVASGNHYVSQAILTSTRETVTPATRGLLLDDDGAALIDNETALVVTVDRPKLLKLGKVKRNKVLANLAPIVGTDADTIWKEVQLCQYKDKVITNRPCWTGGQFQPVPVASFDTQASGADPDLISRRILAIQENAEDFPGIAVTAQAVRTYPQAGVTPKTTLAAHLLGYIAPLTLDDKAKTSPYKNLSDSSLVGRGGLEQQYDAALRGADGIRKIAVNANGDPVKTLSDTAAVSGQDLVLNLDVNIQRAAEQALQNALTKYAPAVVKNPTHPIEASAVVMTTDGRVVAIASTPSYDPSIFTGGISQKKFNALTDPDGGRPLLDRAVDGQYAPGSTWKSFMVAGLLQYNIVQPGEYTDCPSKYTVGKQDFKNFEGESEPPLTLAGALTVSCDTVFYKHAYQEWENDGELREKPSLRKKPANEYLVKAAREFGFGTKTGIDLPGEQPGAIIDRATRQKIFDANKDSYCKGAKTRPPGLLKKYDEENCTDGYMYRGGDATTFSIGQGTNISVTPLQLARGYAAIANGGTLYTPTLAKALVTPDGIVTKRFTPVGTKVATSASDLSYIRDALRTVTHDPKGTASGVFADYPVDVSGKTGTAEVEHLDDTGNPLPNTETSWFASFAPSTNPEYVVVVDVPGSGQGAQVAAPAVKDIYDAIYGVSDGVQHPELAVHKDGKPPTLLPCFKTDTGKVGAPSATCSASLPQPASPSGSPPAVSSKSSSSQQADAGVVDALPVERRRQGGP